MIVWKGWRREAGSRLRGYFQGNQQGRTIKFRHPCERPSEAEV
jgi:hypothetical protein